MPNTKTRLAAGMFVARVAGDSMEPEVPAGSWGLFRAVTQTPSSGSVVLAQHRTSDEPDDAGSFLLKKLEVVRGHARLVSRRPGIAAVTLANDDAAWAVVAVLVEVLGVEPTA